MKIRIKFRKYGPIRFIGHLDVMRYFQKAMRRAQIDIAYTSGFSPHQIMSFAAPLGVGLESNGEYMDIECHSVTSSQDMIQRLNRVGVTGMEVISVKVLPENAGNAMASVAAASYTVRFREGREPQFDWANELQTFFQSQKPIYIMKETKTGRVEVDIRLGIYEIFVVPQDAGKQPAIHMLVDASSAGNLKPGKVMEAFLGAYKEPLQENALLITREDVFTNIGTPENPKRIPLDAVGMDINEVITH